MSKHLAQLVPDVQDARGSLYADYYNYADFSSVIELGHQIKQSMALGKFAVVEGCPDVNLINLSTIGLEESLHIQASETFQVHGKMVLWTCFTDLTIL